MKTPIRWHAEARRLRAQGLTPIEIAMTLNRALSTVRLALAEPDLKTTDRARNRAAPSGGGP